MLQVALSPSVQLAAVVSSAFCEFPGRIMAPITILHHHLALHHAALSYAYPCFGKVLHLRQFSCLELKDQDFASNLLDVCADCMAPHLKEKMCCGISPQARCMAAKSHLRLVAADAAVCLYLDLIRHISYLIVWHVCLTPGCGCLQIRYGSCLQVSSFLARYALASPCC